MNNRTINERKINRSTQPKIQNIRYILSGHKLPLNRYQTKETKETVQNDDNSNFENTVEQSKEIFDNINLVERDYINNLKNQKNNFFSEMEKNYKNNYRDIILKENESNKIDSFSLDNKSKINDEYENIHTLSNINKNYKLERKLLNGYVKPVIKEEVKIRKGIMKFKSFIDTYKKELELYKLVNPIRYKLNEEKEQKEIKYLKKKLEKARELKSGYFNKIKDN